MDTQGEGEPVVLLHGFAGSRRTWDLIAPGLARRHRVLRYDLRGFGESMDIERLPFRHSRDLATVLDDLGLQSCALIGASMGGSVALNFALDSPARVRRLLLVSPAITAWEWSEEWRSLWRPIVKLARSGDLAGARELWWEHPLFATTRAMSGVADRFRESVQSYSGIHWAEGDLEEAAIPDVDRLAGLSVPALLLTGSEDLPDFRLIAGLIEAAAPGVRRIDYAGAGHLLHLERPEEVIADIAAFLE
jgi:2-succinyl-6-hydroxy-2,4-cyclohexadiene-1-carboxylate synthase